MREHEDRRGKKQEKRPAVRRIHASVLEPPRGGAPLGQSHPVGRMLAEDARTVDVLNQKVYDFSLKETVPAELPGGQADCRPFPVLLSKTPSSATRSLSTRTTSKSRPKPPPPRFNSYHLDR